MAPSSITARIEHGVFARRRLLLAFFVLLTLLLIASATHLRVEAGFYKLLPREHEYVRTFTEFHEEFGGANRILVALVVREGDIFTPEFFAALKAVTDEVFFIPGVNRAQVRSLFTPNVRFIEIVEEGFAGGNVIPADFQPTPERLEQVRINILKAGIVGQLVANDFTGAMVSAELLEVDPRTGKRLDYIGVARQLEEKIRQRHQTERIRIHIIGFAKVVGDIVEAARNVIGFFLIAVLITAVLVYLYSRSVRLTVLPLFCSLVAVAWQLGLLPLLGYGMDPLSMLVPFLVFAIGVSHGVQVINAVRMEVRAGADSLTAARTAFRRLLVPGGVALITDAIGFLAILLIRIGIIQETAIAASVGVATIILTNLLFLPVLLSFGGMQAEERGKGATGGARVETLWHGISRVAEPRAAAVVIGIAAGLFAYGLWRATNIRIGDLQRGVPELRADSRYNRDAAVIAERFAIGVDLLSVIAETAPEGCIEYDVMEGIDRFAWRMENVDGVQSVSALPGVVKIVNAGWNEGSLKWRVLPRNRQMMVQAVSQVETASGLLNTDCSAMPVLLFTTDHKAETIERIIAEVKKFRGENPSARVRFRLAGGNVGIMAAMNEAVAAAQFPMVLYVYAAIIAFCIVTFRSLLAAICIVVPLALVSVLTYALMTVLEIGLKVSTLPVVSLGVGIGVDYGIYLFSCFQTCRVGEEQPIPQAYYTTLRLMGSAVLFTGMTLAIGVSTWIFSDLKFQADMGLLLTFIFLANMLGALLLLPALAAWLLPPWRRVAENARALVGLK